MISQAEYAKRRGVTRQFVNRLVKSGKIPASAKGIDPVAADAALEAIRDPNRGKVGPYAKARLQREIYQGLIKKAEYERLTGQLLDSTEVREVWASAFISIRTALDKIPATCCPKCRSVVDGAIGEALGLLGKGGVIRGK